MIRSYRKVLFDLDGCLSDHEERFNAIDHSIEDLDERYRVYHEQAEFDKPINVKIFQKYAEQFNIVICTARPEFMREATEKWLTDNPPSSLNAVLLMRPSDDSRKSPEVKESLIRGYFKARGYNPSVFICMFDDRSDVLAHIENEFGIPGIYLGAPHRLPAPHDCQPATQCHVDDIGPVDIRSNVLADMGEKFLASNKDRSTDAKMKEAFKREDEKSPFPCDEGKLREEIGEVRQQLGDLGAVMEEAAAVLWPVNARQREEISGAQIMAERSPSIGEAFLKATAGPQPDKGEEFRLIPEGKEISRDKGFEEAGKEYLAAMAKFFRALS